MRLKKFIPCRGAQVTVPRISVNASGGLSINKSAMDLLNLGKVDKVDFFEDDENKGNWYVCKNTTLGAFSIKVQKGSHSGVSQSSHFCKHIIDFYNRRGFENKSISFDVHPSHEEESGVKFFALVPIKKK